MKAEGECWTTRLYREQTCQVSVEGWITQVMVTVIGGKVKGHRSTCTNLPTEGVCVILERQRSKIIHSDSTVKDTQNGGTPRFSLSLVTVTSMHPSLMTQK